MSLDRKHAANVLRTISTLAELHGESVHRVRAFANAARAVERIEGDLGEMVATGEVLSVKGIGRGTAAVLEEVASGTPPQALQELEDRTPAGIKELFGVSGLGPKKIRTLWTELDVSSPGELEYACLESRLLELPGFGAKTQERLLEALRFAQHARERRLAPQAWAAARGLLDGLAMVPEVERSEVVGELRRGCETVGQVEVVVATALPLAVERALRSLVGELRGPEEGAWSGVDDAGITCRVWLAEPSSFGAALLWRTGSIGHVEALARRAQASDLRLAGDGLWGSDDRVASRDEEELYRALGCGWVPPELREGAGEVDQAVSGSLPVLVTPEDLRGALHNHTRDSDGRASVEEMAGAARELGWTFLGVADHSPAAHYANGLDAGRLRDQWRRVDELNARGTALRVVKGLEADILADGSLDIPDGCADGLEYVVASVHSSFRLSEEDQTERLLRAVRDPSCRVLGHPTGRLLLSRPGYAVDLEKVLVECAAHGVAVEINASPYRLDLDWRWTRRALELGVKLAISPDAHAIEGLEDVCWGVTVARKAGARPDDLINCAPIEDFLGGERGVPSR